MFPIPFNFPFIKKNGERTTIGDAIGEGGGGGSYTLPTASADTKGGVKVGSGLTMTGEVLSNDNPTPYSLPTAAANTKGGVKIGSGLTMTGEVLSNDNPTPYNLPTASDEVLGGIKVGSGLSILEGVLSVTGGSGGGHCFYVKTTDTRWQEMLIFTNAATINTSWDSVRDAIMYSNGNYNGIALVLKTDDSVASRANMIYATGVTLAGTGVTMSISNDAIAYTTDTYSGLYGNGNVTSVYKIY